jgi:hypothetical protein
MTVLGAINHDHGGHHAAPPGWRQAAKPADSCASATSVPCIGELLFAASLGSLFARLGARRFNPHPEVASGEASAS